MNYKYLKKLDFQYSFLPTFHRGLFWGVIVSWIAVISGIGGAAITQFFVVEKKEVILAKNYAALEKPHTLNSLNSWVESTNSQVTPVSLNNLESSATDFLGIVNPIVTQNFAEGNNYQLVNTPSFSSNLPQKYLFSTVDYSIVTTFDSSLLTYNTSNFKETKIIIQNTTDNSELADQVYVYLQERHFSHIAIAQPDFSNLSKTTITTQSQNLASANYLRSTLSLGILDVVDNQSFDSSSPPILLIQLGQDAQFFATDRNFIN